MRHFTQSTGITALTKVVLFCGGRGSATIIRALLRWPNIMLTLLVNAYDDGASTGLLRRTMGMLGPSDFRKNLSYLLDPFSAGQYALKQLLEYRFPLKISAATQQTFQQSIRQGRVTCFSPLQLLIQQLPRALAKELHHYLLLFFDYIAQHPEPFDLCDCALGNLIFAGIYLHVGKRFNAATQCFHHLVHARAHLFNISQELNCILVALKTDGALLINEAAIVGPQSNVPIKNIFLIEQPITTLAWAQLAHQPLAQKEAWLAEQEQLPALSPEAACALQEADVIVYGPGTQHSSLFPSYKIAWRQLQANTAKKILIMNLATDHDTQSCLPRDIIQQALYYLHDPTNAVSTITHVLLDQHAMQQSSNVILPYLTVQPHYIIDDFAHPYHSAVHNGHKVVQTLLALTETTCSVPHRENAQTHDDPTQIPQKTAPTTRPCISAPYTLATIDIFVDIHQRSWSLTTLLEELLELEWHTRFATTTLIFHRVTLPTLTLPPGFITKTSTHHHPFPEVDYFFDWLQHGTSDYLLLLTGDGEYRVQDIVPALLLLAHSQFGAIFGSRNQNYHQFKHSLQAAYCEKTLLRYLSLMGHFIMSTLFALRFHIIFSDTLTGWRLFKRSRIKHLNLARQHRFSTPVAITKYLIRQQVEIAELPVYYRTFAGFADPVWRFKRGLKNLGSLLWP